MRIGDLLFNKIIPSIIIFFGIKKSSWKHKKVNVFIQSAIMFPFKRVRGIRRTPYLVEKQYDDISGNYITDNYYSNKERFCVAHGKIQKKPITENMRLIRNEIRQVLREYEFNNILEIGAGELTTLEDIFNFKKSKIDCYGIDLSLNRLVHGVQEFKKRHNTIPYVAKANATELPFADNSFDLVITRHTLEQMPKIFKFSIDEIIRVSKKNIIFFEPSFELGSVTQKLKMLNSDYVRGIPKYLSTKKDLDVKDAYLMKNSANPLNHTACTEIKIKKSDDNNLNQRTIPFVCPISKEILQVHNDFLYATSSSIAYPIINGIPIIEPSNSFKLTKI
tara:strand:- start:3686 stop:4687 length:1002 start_codon:yes stop_codon:yes gene_type:complete